jgi:hypothetical protein
MQFGQQVGLRPPGQLPGVGRVDQLDVGRACLPALCCFSSGEPDRTADSGHLNLLEVA